MRVRMGLSARSILMPTSGAARETLMPLTWSIEWLMLGGRALPPTVPRGVVLTRAVPFVPDLMRRTGDEGPTDVTPRRPHDWD